MTDKRDKPDILAQFGIDVDRANNSTMGIASVFVGQIRLCFAAQERIYRKVARQVKVLEAIEGDSIEAEESLAIAHCILDDFKMLERRIRNLMIESGGI